MSHGQLEKMKIAHQAIGNSTMGEKTPIFLISNAKGSLNQCHMD
jgi:hypothetical protein